MPTSTNELLWKVKRPVPVHVARLEAAPSRRVKFSTCQCGYVSRSQPRVQDQLGRKRAPTCNSPLLTPRRGHESHFVVEALADRLIAAADLEPVGTVVEARFRVPVLALFFDTASSGEDVLAPAKLTSRFWKKRKLASAPNTRLKCGPLTSLLRNITPMSDAASTSRRSRSAVKLAEGVRPSSSLLDVQCAHRVAAGAAGQPRAAKNRNGASASPTSQSGG